MGNSQTPAQSAFAALLRFHIGPPLRSLGFLKVAANWRLRGKGCWGVINVQKSVWGDRNEIRFMVNLGVSFDAIARAEHPTKKALWTKAPAASACDIQTRIGTLGPAQRDQWWTLRGPRDLEKVVAAVLPLLMKRGVPWLRRHMSSPAIRRSAIASAARARRRRRRRRSIVIYVANPQTMKVERVVTPARR